jgi:uncharacterized OB-fold protein
MQGVPPVDIIGLTPSRFTEPFWRATVEHRLVVPRCVECGAFRFPPAAFCFACRAQAVEWVEHDGRGAVYSFTVVRHAVIPQVKDALPFIAAVVELPGTGGCRLVGNIVDCMPEAVRIDLPVQVDWYDVREAVTIPVFRIADP